MTYKIPISKKREKKTPYFVTGKQIGLEKGEIDSYTKKTLNKWIEEGNHVAVYRNVDLGHYEVGKLAFMKVGKNATFKEAPNRMPDNSKIPIAWRYRLETEIKTKKDLEKL